MPFYEDRGKKPRRKDSIGPEEGYRPRGKGAYKPDDRQNRNEPNDKSPNRFEGYQRDGNRSTSGRSDSRRPFQSGTGSYRPKENKSVSYQNSNSSRYPKDGIQGTENARPLGARYRANEALRKAPPQAKAIWPALPQGNAVRQDSAQVKAVRPGTMHRPPANARPIKPVEPYIDAPFEGEEPIPRENMLSGRNPIREAIKSGRDMEKLLVAKGELSGSAREIVAMAREARIVVQVVDRARLDEITQHHQGMIAFASAFRYATVEEMLARAKERGEDPLLVILDGITDPHNLGAIIRSAECAGAHGVIIPERRAVGLTPAAVKASAGAIEHLPVARVGNLTRFLETLKDEGIWIVAADMGGEPYTAVSLTGPLALMIGAEGTGVSRLVLSSCDRRVALPIRGKIDSLNASVAAGVLLYEIRRQRG